MEPRIRIRSHVVGFRRAGVAHEADRIWPAGHFSPEQLEILKGEPTLTVIELPPVEPEAPVGETREAWAKRIADSLAAGIPASELRASAGAEQNSEDRPAAQPEVQKAEPEPSVEGARTSGDEAKSLPVAVVSRAEPPSETGKAANAGSETALAADPVAKPNSADADKAAPSEKPSAAKKPPSTKPPGRKKAD